MLPNVQIWCVGVEVGVGVRSIYGVSKMCIDYWAVLHFADCILGLKVTSKRQDRNLSVLGLVSVNTNCSSWFFDNGVISIVTH